MTTPSGVFVATRGGIISVPHLRHLAARSRAQGTGRIHFTCAQQFLLPGLDDYHLPMLRTRLDASQLHARTGAPRVLSTAPSAAITPHTPWLTEGAYLSVLESIPAGLPFSVAITDPAQPWLPCLLEELNLVAAPQRDLWQLVISPQSLHDAPLIAGALRSADLPEALRALAASAAESPRWCAPEAAPIAIATLKPWLTHSGNLPALSRRLEPFPPNCLSIADTGLGVSAALLEDLAILATQSGRLSLGLLPCHALLVHTASAEHLHEVRQLMARHSQPESTAPWQNRIHDRVASPGLRGALMAVLQEALPVDLGLTAAIIKDTDSLPGADILLLRHKRPRWFLRERISLLLRNRDGAHRIVLKQIPFPSFIQIAGATLREHLLAEEISEDLQKIASEPQNMQPDAHRCSRCMYEYSGAFGDPFNELPPGLPFEQLPPHWACPVCGAPKSDYTPAAV